MPRSPVAERVTHEAMLRLITGFWVSQCIHVAARFRIADALADGPRSASAVARRAGIPADATQRLLTVLVDSSVFARDARGRFRLTALGAQLRDCPGSLRAFALLMMADCNWNAFGKVSDALVTKSSSAFELANGMSAYEYLRRHAELERLLSDLQGDSTRVNADIARSYPFSRFQSLVDLGGSGGQLLGAILARHTQPHGILFDQPQVVEQARANGIARATHLQGRLQLIGGDFFEGVPRGADAYMLRFILHNWDDGQCIRILSNCRRAMVSKGTVLILEHLLKQGNGHDYTRISDIGMMVLTGGRERNREHYAQLLRRAGLKLRRVIPTPSPLGVATPLSILEATRVR